MYDYESNLRVKRAAKHLIQTVREIGPAGAFRQALGAARRYFGPTRSDPFDRKHRVDTVRQVPLWRLNISSPNAEFGVKYQTVDPDIFKEAVSFVPNSPTDYVFLDLGCGKGRTLILASELKFRRAIGVEFSPELAAIARANATKTGASVEVYDGDAQTFTPPSDNLVIYMFNPFGPSVLTHVIENLVAWRSRNAAEAFLVYVNPVHAKLFEGNPGFRPIASTPTARVWAF